MTLRFLPTFYYLCRYNTNSIIYMSDIKLYQTRQVRTHWDDKVEKWCFAIVDVNEILTGSTKPWTIGTD